MRTIFVFGSNRKGWHGAGAALHALRYKGAIYGQAEGLQGDSYGIVTKELRRDYADVDLEEVKAGVKTFLHFAASRLDLVFELTPIGCGLAGFSPKEIAPLFENSSPNVVLPQMFIDSLYDHQSP